MSMHSTISICKTVVMETHINLHFLNQFSENLVKNRSSFGWKQWKCWCLAGNAYHLQHLTSAPEHANTSKLPLNTKYNWRRRKYHFQVISCKPKYWTNKKEIPEIEKKYGDYRNYLSCREHNCWHQLSETFHLHLHHK